ncbi:MAG: 30S ribosomal protein S6 [Acidimicrobiia bacterium]
MRAYELMVILSSDLDDGATEANVRGIVEQVQAKGGEVRRTDRWGRRRFAYEIDHRHDGYYVVFEILAVGGDLDDLERQLRLADDVVRHKLIRLPDSEAEKRGLVEGQAPAPAG